MAAPLRQLALFMSALLALALALQLRQPVLLEAALATIRGPQRLLAPAIQ